MKRLLLSTIIAILCVQHHYAQEFIHIGEEAIPLSNITQITHEVKVHPGSLSLLLEKDSNISIYVSALKATGMMDSLKFCIDDTYSIMDVEDSCRYKNMEQSYYRAFPEERRFNFTFLACPDSILLAKHNIKDLNGLRAKAKEIYSDIYPEDAGVTNETDRRNYLNRFISYQLLDFYGKYYTLTDFDNGIVGENFVRDYEIPNYYATMMPHSLIKFSFDRNSHSLYVNHRAYDETKKTTLFSPHQMKTVNLGVNGAYHYIDDIVAYDKYTQEVVLNERLRFDFTTLSPDFMTILKDGESARGHSLPAGCYPAISISFKAGYVRNFEFNNSTALHILTNRTSNWGSYLIDEILPSDNFDITIKLPPVPAGRYELRLGTSITAVSDCAVLYIDGKAVDVVDFREPVTDYGWTDFVYSDIYEKEQAIDDERCLRNNGYMKGPANFITFNQKPIYNYSGMPRKIIGTFYTDGKSDHYLRIKRAESPYNNSTMGFRLDYLELVPSTVYDNEEVLEDNL
ncbi:MAG: hypothetical protein IJA46_08210 [Bacteroidaceae bacterium]|nr:hypothetical protein [Bacteroidaceae bacterium]